MNITTLPLSKVDDFGYNEALFKFKDVSKDNKLKEQYMGFTSYLDFFDNDSYQIVEIPNKHIDILTKISSIGFVKKAITEIYRDEFDDIVNDMEKINIPFFTDGAFVRLNYYSPKDSVFWPSCLPFKDWKSLLLVLATSSRVASSLSFPEGNKLIIRPWNGAWEEKNEFRVFVKDKKITVISQYYIYTDFGIDNWTDEKKYDLINRIDEFHESIKDRYILDDYVMDVHVTDIVELIEFNSFHLAGACCFNWKYDNDTMNDNKVIEFRYVVK
jgi:hypothetical protein